MIGRQPTRPDSSTQSSILPSPSTVFAAPNSTAARIVPNHRYNWNRRSLTPQTGNSRPISTVKFTSTLYRVTESVGVAQITIERAGAINRTVSVEYGTGKNTAMYTQDYVGTAGTRVTFQPGELSKTVTIPIVSDDVFETAEVLRLYLKNPSRNAGLGDRSKALLTIENDDNPTEDQIRSRAVNQINIGTKKIYIGYNQVSFDNDIGNQDPWLASFTNGRLNWYHDDYEITPDDGRGTHLFWDRKTNSLYGAFTATGIQGTPDQDFRRFATHGWLRSYTDGSPRGGGGAQVAIVARINPANGLILYASYLSALNGLRTNAVNVQSLASNHGNLVVKADSFYAPRRPDRTAMVRNGNLTTSPNYTVEFTPDLSTVVRAEAVDYQ